MLKAVIFDRDGTLIKDYGYFCNPDKIKWLKGSLKILKYLKVKRIKCFIVTNQSGVGRGYFTERQLKLFHLKLKNEINFAGGRINKIFYCPHHSKAKISIYKKKCKFRKPDNGFLKKILSKYNLKPSEVIMLGDKKSDFISAKKSKIGFYYKSNRINLYQQMINIINDI